MSGNLYSTPSNLGRESFRTPQDTSNAARELFLTPQDTPIDARGVSLTQFKKGVKKRLPESIREWVEKIDDWVKRNLMVSREDDMSHFVMKFGLVILITLVMVWIVYELFQFLQCKGLEKLQKESETFSFPSSLLKKATWWMFFFLFLIYFTMTFSEIVLENIIFVLRGWLGKKRKWIPRNLFNLQQFAILIYIGYQMWISVYSSCMTEIVADVIQQNIWILAAPSIFKLCKGLWKLIQSRPKDSYSPKEYLQKILQFIIDLVLPILMYYLVVRPFQSSCSTENEKIKNLYTTYYTTITFVVYIFFSLVIENFFSMIEFYKEFKIQISNEEDILLLFHRTPNQLVNHIIPCEDKEELIKSILVLRSEFGNSTNSKFSLEEGFDPDMEYSSSLNHAKKLIFPLPSDLQNKSISELKKILWRAYLVFRQTLWNTNLFWKIAYTNRDKTDITQFPSLIFDNKDKRNNYFNDHSILKIAYQDPLDPAFKRSQNLVNRAMENKINYTFLTQIINPKNYSRGIWGEVFGELKHGTYYELMALLFSLTYEQTEPSRTISPVRPPSRTTTRIPQSSNGLIVQQQGSKQDVSTLVIKKQIEVIYRGLNTVLLCSLFVGIYWLYFLIHLFQNRSSNPCSLRIFGINIPQWCLFLLVLMTMILWSIAIHVLKFVVSTQHFPEIPR